MRHKRVKKHFSRRPGPRKALIKGLVTALVEHERINTTLQKAKELRKHVERAITKGKDGTMHARRVLLSDYANQNTVEKIVTNLAVRFKARAGGYTRILKVGRRPGDCAEMALIEFVDYKTGTEKPAKDGKSEKAGKKADKKSEKGEEKVAAKKDDGAKDRQKAADQHRRRKRKLQRQDRQAARNNA